MLHEFFIRKFFFPHSSDLIIYKSFSCHPYFDKSELSQLICKAQKKPQSYSLKATCL